MREAMPVVSRGSVARSFGLDTYKRWRNHPLFWLTLVTICHGSLYAFLFPPWQGLDEPNHYTYLRALASVDTLVPTSLPRDPEVYRQVVESLSRYRLWSYNKLPTPADLPGQPPFDHFAQRAASIYYRLSLPVYWLVQSWPLESQLYALRFFSVGLQVLTVWATYQLTAMLLAGEADETLVWLWPTAAAAVVALFPMYTFVSISYNDDNLLPPVVAISLYALLRGLKQGGHPGWWMLAGLGAIVALLTKRTGVSLVILVGLCSGLYATLWLQTRQRFWRFVGGAVLAGVVVTTVLAAWIVLFPFQLSTTVARWFQLAPDALITFSDSILNPTRLSSIDWAAEFIFLSVSFWGWFGYLKIPFGQPVMEVLRPVTLLVLTGSIIGWLHNWNNSKQPSAALRFRIGAMLILVIGLLINLFVLIAQFLVGPPVYLLVGRYLFPFVSAFAVIAVGGWLVWWPRHFRLQGLLAALGGLALLDIIAVWTLIIPYYYS